MHRIIFLATPAFALPSLQALIASPHQLLAIITQPDRPAGRGKQLQAPAIKQLALQHNLPLYQTASISKDKALLQQIIDLKPDLMITCAFGQLLSQAVLDIAPVYNVHASLLPHWRGAAPIQRAILAGDNQTGISIMQTVLALDAGDVLLQQTIAIEQDDYYPDLSQKLADLGAELLMQMLDVYPRIRPQPQDTTLVSIAKKPEKELSQISWSQHSAQEIDRRVHALNPQPGVFFVHANQTVKIRSSSLADTHGQPGEIIAVHKDGSMLLACTQGTLKLEAVQPEGKKSMPAAAWFHGLQNKPSNLCQ